MSMAIFSPFPVFGPNCPPFCSIANLVCNLTEMIERNIRENVFAACILIKKKTSRVDC